jgi:hypothetical protein
MKISSFSVIATNRIQSHRWPRGPANQIFKYFSRGKGGKLRTIIASFNLTRARGSILTKIHAIIISFVNWLGVSKNW